MTTQLPALCLIGVPGRRRLTIELCQETERRGFAGIYSPSPFGAMSLCEALAWNTNTIPFGTAIAPIYQRTIVDFVHERGAQEGLGTLPPIIVAALRKRMVALER